MNKVELMIEKLGEALSPDERDAIIGQITAKGKEVFTSLLNGLASDNARIRARCALALGELGDQRAVDYLIEMMSDDRLLVRESVLFALIDIGSKSKAVVRKLVESLDDGYAPIREMAAYGLSQIADPSSTTALIALLGDSDPEVVDEARFALEAIGEPAVSELIEALANQNQQIRINAADVLGEIGDRRAIEPLQALLNSGDETLRLTASISLQSLKGTEE